MSRLDLRVYRTGGVLLSRPKWGWPGLASFRRSRLKSVGVPVGQRLRSLVGFGISVSGRFVASGEDQGLECEEQDQWSEPGDAGDLQECADPLGRRRVDDNSSRGHLDVALLELCDDLIAALLIEVRVVGFGDDDGDLDVSDATGDLVELLLSAW